MYKKYKYLLDAPFEISNRCCYYSKEKPCIDYEKQSGNKAIIGTTTEESRQREDGWLKTGCNAFDGNRPISKPMSFWKEQDILRYIALNEIKICSVYGDIVYKDDDGFLYNFNELSEGSKLTTTGCKRTGCMYCAFGAQCEKMPNRFQMLKETHPKQYEYCLRDIEKGGLGMKKVLDFIGVYY